MATRYTCQHCGSEHTDVMVQQQVVFPSEHSHNLTRKFMASKEFRHLGILWETGDIICRDCGRVSDGFGNYVTNLAKSNKELRYVLKHMVDCLREGSPLHTDLMDRAKEALKEKK